jgi:hypothetical protein
MVFGLHEDILGANTKMIKKKKSLLSKPHLSLPFLDISPSDTDDDDLAQTLTAIPSYGQLPQTSILRHVHSVLNLQGCEWGTSQVSGSSNWVGGELQFERVFTWMAMHVQMWWNTKIWFSYQQLQSLKDGWPNMQAWN